MGWFTKNEGAEEGLVETYSVVYRGGHPDYPDSKVGAIEFKVYQDRFELLPTMGTKRWFKGLIIKYDQITDLQIVQRQVGTVEGILGGLASRQLNQPNNIHISYNSGEQNVLLRLEMLSGLSVMGQARKCQELEDRLRVHRIREKFCQATSSPSQTGSVQSDIPDQLKKLAALLQEGVLTQQEFDAKKADLLSRM